MRHVKKLPRDRSNNLKLSKSDREKIKKLKRKTKNKRPSTPELREAAAMGAAKGIKGLGMKLMKKK